MVCVEGEATYPAWCLLDAARTVWDSGAGLWRSCLPPAAPTLQDTRDKDIVKAVTRPSSQNMRHNVTLPSMY